MGDDRQLRWVTTPSLMALSGALAGLSVAPLGWSPLLWLALVPLWACADATGSSSRWAGVRGAGLWGAMAVLVSHRWLLWLHPLDWVGVPLPLSLPVCLALWLFCGLAASLLVALWCLVAQSLNPRRWPTALLAAATWGLAEVWLSGGPLFWFGLGGSPLPGDWPLAGVAAIGGAALVAALQLLIGWVLWRALGSASGPRRRWWIGLALLVAVVHLLGWSQLRPARAEHGERLRVMVLQPAVPTRRKFEPAEQFALLRLLAAARAEAATLQAEPLLLPEGALALGQTLPSAESVEVLSGGFRLEGDSTRSSILRFAPAGVRPSGAIDKHRVVPLGEWVPMARWWRWSGLSAVGGVEPGTRSRLLRRPEGAIAVAICYEIADGRALSEAVREGAGWLLASANLDPYPPLLQQQFTALSRMRAIETGRWVVSAANTGPSLVVDSTGGVRETLPAGRALAAPLNLEVLGRLTPYGRWGEGPMLLMLLIGVAFRLRAAPPRR
jgi:apolipoprotein N-acyltransferase